MGQRTAVYHQAQEWVHPVEAALSMSFTTLRGAQTLALSVHGLMGQRGPIPTEVVVHAARTHLQQAAQQATLEAARGGTGWSQEAALGAFLADVHRTLLGLSRIRPYWGGLGVEVAAAWFAEGRVAIAHAGNCRVFRLRGGEGAVQLTVDHSLLEDARRSGWPNWEQFAAKEYRNIVVRLLGMEYVPAPPPGTPEADGRAPAAEPRAAVPPWEMRSEAVLPGDVYLLGTSNLEPEAVRACLGAGAGTDAEADSEAALERMLARVVAALAEPPNEVACVAVREGRAGEVPQAGSAGERRGEGDQLPSPEERYAGMGLSADLGQYARIMQEG
ncbi:PP2C family protein-serine/threonine phosphatase [Chondromyces apiculatus]|uniref:PPM-type phosphatase domain-containing protein n=1 Tax=Chondromyces apiculatus DSM 436 TaxID=1192034 RepID=A0A017THT6_9BACT|nr:hypothetical protein [Chondromyces apiculatus]EYF08156.1 Hypothetical protein CAP_5916 [Chondromyces apiculatus DSM 436]